MQYKSLSMLLKEQDKKMIIWTISSILLSTIVVVYGQASGFLSLRACLGSDANVFHVCNVYPNTSVWGPQEIIGIQAWTYNALGCPFGQHRYLLRFPKLNLIPSCAKVNSAKLSLFGPGPDPDHYREGAFSCYPDSPYTPWCSNNVSVTRITEPWSPNTVTWNTQPSSTGPVSIIPTSTSQFYYNPTIDVTSHVQAMVALKQGLYGFKMTVTHEDYYRAMKFFSSHASAIEKRPLLQVEYTVPCNCEPCQDSVGTETGPDIDVFSPESRKSSS